MTIQSKILSLSITLTISSLAYALDPCLQIAGKWNGSWQEVYQEYYCIYNVTADVSNYYSTVRLNVSRTLVGGGNEFWCSRDTKGFIISGTCENARLTLDGFSATLKGAIINETIDFSNETHTVILKRG